MATTAHEHAITPGFSEEGHVWITDAHQVVATLPLKVKETRTEREIRSRLKDVVMNRFPLVPQPLAEKFMVHCESSSLMIIEDSIEHGHQYGVVLQKVDV